jgi:hypothetical protein
MRFSMFRILLLSHKIRIIYKRIPALFELNNLP